MKTIQIAVGNILFTKGMIDCLKEYDIEPSPKPATFTFSTSIEADYNVYRLMYGSDISASRAYLRDRRIGYYQSRLMRLKMIITF